MRTSFISIIISIAIVILLGLWVYLLVTYLRNPNIRLSDTNITNKIHTSKILSYLSPGFGKILVGNGWKKYSLFIIYILLQIFSSMSGIEWSGKTPFNLSEKVLSMIGPSFNWIVFKLIDGYYINKYETFMKKDTEKKESTLELPPVIDINQDFQGEP